MEPLSPIYPILGGLLIGTAAGLLALNEAAVVRGAYPRVMRVVVQNGRGQLRRGARRPGDGVRAQQGGGHHGQGDPCVSTGGFDQFVSDFDVTSFQSRADHVVCCPVFYTSPWILTFHFAEDPDLGI